MIAILADTHMPTGARRLPDRCVELVSAGPARGRLARLRRRFPNADAVVFGHSHLPLHEEEGGFRSSTRL
jgi:predicted phosphodiesterase